MFGTENVGIRSRLKDPIIFHFPSSVASSVSKVAILSLQKKFNEGNREHNCKGVVPPTLQLSLKQNLAMNDNDHEKRTKSCYLAVGELDSCSPFLMQGNIVSRNLFISPPGVHRL